MQQASRRTDQTGAKPASRLPDERFLVALLIIGFGLASACSAQLFERETDLPPEELAPATCTAKECLVVEQNSIYCSIDPFELRDGAVFATKSRLQISPGTYELSNRHALSGLSIRVDTPTGEHTLTPLGDVAYSLQREEFDRETRVEPLEWIEAHAAYGDEGVRIEKFFLRTSRWPHARFRLGDPGDTRWFFAAARSLLLRVSRGGGLFPGLSDQTIRYAPCAMWGIPDQPFTFEFDNGSVLNLSARAISGSHQIGYYVGRLMAARGHWENEPIDVRDKDDLAFFGSTWSGGEAAIPTFAVRTSAREDICGFILDSSRWDTPAAVDGYVAYEMTCQQRRGRRLPLTAVSYPDFFALP